MSGPPPALPPPFDAPPPPAGVETDPATLRLVTAQVQALLDRTPAYYALPPSTRSALSGDLVNIGAYAAALVRDDWAQSARLHQRPLIRRRERLPAGETRVELAASQATAGEIFRPAAVDNVARVTRETLEAISFPAFVADLIQGSFRAIVDSSIQQMQAFVDLIGNVSKTVDEFMVDNVSDNQARDWLAGRYPEHIEIRQGEDGPRAAPRDDAPEAPPDFRGELNLSEAVDALDEETVEARLVPAARRRLAQARLRMLSTLVLMGMQRIVVRHGKIKAGMRFKIDASDRVARQEASQFDMRTSLSGGIDYVVWSAKASISVTYVSTTRTDSQSALEVGAELTGEVEIAFETDYFPLARLAPPETIERIRGNTPVPDQNTPRAAPPPVLETAPAPVQAAA